jgi:nucleoside-diphosphate-sugar epimerase
VFNIGYGQEISINEVCARILEETGKKDEIRPRYLPSPKGEFPRTYTDNRKAQRVLGWKPKVDFHKGLHNFINWFKSVNIES